MPPDRFRPPGGETKGAQAKQPGVGLLNATLPPTTKNAQAHLLALIEKELDGPVRCGACQRPLHALRSVLAGIGPRCAAKRVKRP
jgi:hypothetical protein